jgi:hypothetical protein
MWQPSKPGSSVQAPGGGADDLGQAALHCHVDVLQLAPEDEFAARDLRFDGLEPGFDGCHTARSRNDQVATDMRLWVRDTLDALDAQVADLQRAIST